MTCCPQPYGMRAERLATRSAPAMVRRSELAAATAKPRATAAMTPMALPTMGGLPSGGGPAVAVQGEGWRLPAARPPREGLALRSTFRI